MVKMEVGSRDSDIIILRYLNDKKLAISKQIVQDLNFNISKVMRATDSLRRFGLIKAIRKWEDTKKFDELADKLKLKEKGLYGSTKIIWMITKAGERSIKNSLII